MALTQFLPMDSYYHGILAATVLVPCLMTGLVLGKLGKLARLWYKNFLSPSEEIFPFKSRFPCMGGGISDGLRYLLFQALSATKKLLMTLSRTLFLCRLFVEKNLISA